MSAVIAKTYCKMVEHNQCGEGLQYLAEQIGATRYAEIMFHINAIHKLEIGLPVQIYDFRTQIKEAIFACARAALDEKSFGRIESAGVF